ncbi:MAG: DUF488 domain-containing protein [Candidatus Acidiferrales bacterium]
MFKVKRIYEAATPEDGYRVLVDRIWPRGMSKEKAHVDLWMKEIGPSDRVRKWFGHDPNRWAEFQKRYRGELKKNSELVGELRAFEKKHGTVTLVYSARDDQHNQAVALREFLKKAL